MGGVGGVVVLGVILGGLLVCEGECRGSGGE